MIRHLITLIWNRRRANGLLVSEIFLAFIAVFAVTSLIMYMRQNYQTPLGFEYQDVWQINLKQGAQSEQRYATLQQVVQRLKATPGVTSVARSGENTPFSFNNGTAKLDAGEGANKRQSPSTDIYFAGPELQKVLDLQIAEGRWFDRRDEAATRRPVVITEATRAALFPNESPIGKVVRGLKEEWQVVGVTNSYRAGGELSTPRPAIMLYVSPNDTAEALSTLLVRVAPGSGAALKKQIGEQIHSTSPSWTSTIVALGEQRLAKLKMLLALPAMLGIVCLFLTMNVALGIFGVMWLNISRRRVEIGLRRAIGASAGSISSQILGEILIITTFGLLLGVLAVIQFPILGVFSVPASVYFLAIGLGLGLIYGLVTLCAVYPSQLATGIRPALSLREE
ncbi:ABC transporter permease [Hymenobacter cellulosivorans]|uniref:ABC transporter permease n=1 Tax=Hymenobacter cellulosivorans TaxID=2932249 RepID=A0ABY4FAR5_9BACT|nr:ABC transporter permease [Hymenobacter cellulosivorans]UOQ53766.1 ABC transporter permease [Hymenobacter cellulosivorans]